MSYDHYDYNQYEDNFYLHEIQQRVYDSQMKKIPHDFYKTKLCPLNLLEICPKGSNCNFAHREDELRNPPNFIKTKLCVPFMKNGYCKFGNNCGFAHGEAELRSTLNNCKSPISNAWAKGKCNAGPRCKFAQANKEIRPMAIGPANSAHLLKAQQNYQIQKSSDISYDINTQLQAYRFNFDEDISYKLRPKNNSEELSPFDDSSDNMNMRSNISDWMDMRFNRVKEDNNIYERKTTSMLNLDYFKSDSLTEIFDLIKSQSAKEVEDDN